MRRKFVLDLKFQLSFTLSFVFGIVGIFIVLGIFEIGPLFYLAKNPSLTTSQRDILLSEGKWLLQVMAFLLFIVVVASGIAGFYLSNKFIGPLFRLEDWLHAKLESGDPTAISARPGDDLRLVAKMLSTKAKL